MRYARFPETALVVAAHPDDEIIGAGLLIGRLSCAEVVHVTDGAPRNNRDARAAGFAGWNDYAATRRAEAEAALALVEVQPDHLLRLGVPDQGASDVLAETSRRLAEVIGSRSFGAVVTHAYEGGHPDHDATAFAVHAARLLLRAGEHPTPILLEMTGYHAANGALASGTFIPNAEAGPTMLLEPDAGELSRKQRMIDCHATQRAVLSQFPIGPERFRRAPRYDFRHPPHSGVLNYERYEWGMTGDRWRWLANAALEELGLDRREGSTHTLRRFD
ncbi:MAG: hypothetical protein JWL84_567 [Rhodospirillales bacterium]|jgi:LmbE family N-acetylglucosaminyl deacetylase|nr:hypothetical protein [Rhodospirillales bacterium]